MESVLIGLLYGLARLESNDDTYLVLRRWGQPDWLAPYLANRQRLVSGPRPPGARLEQVKRLLGPLRSPLGRLARAMRSRGGGNGRRRSTMPIAVSDGFYETLGADVLHLTYPLHFVRTKVPTVFTVHDLQHRHHPEFFLPEQLEWRERVYPAALRHADAVATISTFVADDLVKQYGVDRAKVHVIPFAAATNAYPPVPDDAVQATVQKFQLPSWFVLYPAMTYAHKNHLRLLEALARLRDERSMTVPLVCTGLRTPFWPEIERRVRELDLEGQVRFLGFVSALEVRALYRASRFVVFPTLFEGAGLPVLEAFREDIPITCSDIPAVREYAGDAALFFDPTSVDSIAEAVATLALDVDCRDRLRRMGRARSEVFTWRRTAAAYRALYRQVARNAVAEADRDSPDNPSRPAFGERRSN